MKEEDVFVYRNTENFQEKGYFKVVKEKKYIKALICTATHQNTKRFLRGLANLALEVSLYYNQ